MFHSPDNRANNHQPLSVAATALCIGAILAGCVNISVSDQKRLQKLSEQRITLETPPAGFSAPNSQTGAAVLNALPGFGSFYLASGTEGHPSHFLSGAANFLLWPISVVWAVPEAYIDAGRINRLALIKYCDQGGDASSAPIGLQEEYERWRSGRADTKMVVSKSNDPQVASIINGVAVIPGEVYGYLSNGSDWAMARNAGREIYEAIMRDKNAGTPIEEIRKALSDADRAAAAEYGKFVESQNYATLGEKLAGIAAKLVEDGAKIGGAVAQIKNLDSMKGKNPLALAAALKEPATEVNTIKNQLADAVKACSYWQDLNKQDEMAQKFMKDYPIEK